MDISLSAMAFSLSPYSCVVSYSVLRQPFCGVSSVSPVFFILFCSLLFSSVTPGMCTIFYTSSWFLFGTDGFLLLGCDDLL